MRLMNEVVKPFIGKFVVVYLDDILVFSKTKEHLQHLDMVLQRLDEDKLMINLKKCEFMKDELTYLGFVISKGTLKMDSSKVEAILNWPTTKSVSDVRRFHGLASFYRKFIKGFSHSFSPMIDTVKGDKKRRFQWIEEVEKSFQHLKTRVAQQPILALPDFNKIFTIECDVALESVLFLVKKADQ